jgi:hypothetical protein
MKEYHKYFKKEVVMPDETVNLCSIPFQKRTGGYSEKITKPAVLLPVLLIIKVSPKSIAHLQDSIEN